MLTYLGIHAIDQTPDYKPTLCSEYKRRIFAQMYNSDKLGTAFFGRPPLIHRQYCSAPLPLDLPDDALISDENTLAEMVAALDDRGWNKDGKIHPVTVVRARCMLAYIYDSLFEIALARDGKERSSYLLYVPFFNTSCGEIYQTNSLTAISERRRIWREPAFQKA